MWFPVWCYWCYYTTPPPFLRDIPCNYNTLNWCFNLTCTRQIVHVGCSYLANFSRSQTQRLLYHDSKNYCFWPEMSDNFSRYYCCVTSPYCCSIYLIFYPSQNFTFHFLWKIKISIGSAAPSHCHLTWQDGVISFKIFSMFYTIDGLVSLIAEHWAY